MRVREYLAVSALLLLVASCGSDTGSATTTEVSSTESAATSESPPSTPAPTTSVAPTEELAMDLELGLLAHYPFDGDAADAGPGMMHGVVAGPVAVADRGGDPAGALGFDGFDDLITLDDEGFALGGTFSITMWLRGNAASDHQWVILSDHSAGECQPVTPSWILRYDEEAGIFFSVYDSIAECGSHYGYGSPILLDDDQWHHLALVASGGGLRIYSDCEEIMSMEAAIDLPDGPYGLLVGNQGGSPQNTAFDGSLDDLRFYDRSLEPVEIAALCLPQ